MLHDSSNTTNSGASDGFWPDISDIAYCTLSPTVHCHISLTCLIHTGTVNTAKLLDWFQCFNLTTTMVIAPVIGFYEVALASAWPCSATLDYIFVSTGVNSRAVNVTSRNFTEPQRRPLLGPGRLWWERATNSLSYVHCYYEWWSWE